MKETKTWFSCSSVSIVNFEHIIADSEMSWVEQKCHEYLEKNVLL